MSRWEHGSISESDEERECKYMSKSAVWSLSGTRWDLPGFRTTVSETAA